MILLQPSDITYPTADDRFAEVPSSLTLDQCVAWADAMPPSPEFNPVETYSDFTKRQTAYAAYRNAVVETRDRLKKAEGALLIPKAPVGEDIMEAVRWVQNSGQTPLEFLTKTYRDTSQQMGHRITAASKLMEFIHRRMPSTIDHQSVPIIPSSKSIDKAALSTLSQGDLVTLEELLDKMSKNV